MASLKDMAKQAVNKITDEMNKNKWDKNSINPALLASADGAAIPVNPTAAAPILPNAGSHGPQPTTPPENPVLLSGTTSQPSPLPAGSGNILPEYTKPVFKSRFSGPGTSTQTPTIGEISSLDKLPIVDPSQKISNIGKETAHGFLATPAKPLAPAEPVHPIVQVKEYCYYVQITHTKTYPAPGSRVLMRSCDHEYVWTNLLPEDQKPNYAVCPKCSKEIRYTETEMD